MKITSIKICLSISAPGVGILGTMESDSEILKLTLLKNGANISHLSEGSSGRKQKCIHFLTSFSGTVIHALSHGVIFFVLSVSFKNLEFGSFWLAVEKFQPMRKQFFKLTHRTKRITPSQRASKTVPKNDVGSCVHFCLRSLGYMERCDMLLFLFLVKIGHFSPFIPPLHRNFCSECHFNVMTHCLEGFQDFAKEWR